MAHPHLRTRRSGILLLIGVIGILAVAACSSPSSKSQAGSKHFNPLNSTTTTATVDPHALHLPANFVLPDTRFVSLLPVPGRSQPAPVIPVRGGKATVEGTVTGPSGPVAGATVRIERWVGSASGALTIGTDGSGRFAAAGVLGGHYTVRAWQQPALATFDAATGFVADGGVLSVNVVMQQHNSFTVQVAASTGAISVGHQFSLLALVTRESVDANGIVQAGPVAGESVTLSSDPGLTIAGANPATTGADGLATWTLTCKTAGSFSAVATTKDGSGTTNLPTCTGGPSTTTPPPTVIPLAVGDSFTVPDPGPYPAGDYQTTSKKCSITFQVYVNGNWKNGHSSGKNLTLAGPGQNFQSDPGSPDCTYTRVS